MSSGSNYISRQHEYPSSQSDINILMMGETGAGKSTFINAFANYLLYNTLKEAMRGQMQVLIPSTFSMGNPSTFEPIMISVGEQTDNEECVEVGQSGTQFCRSYVFPIGSRLLRLIDAPGIGDVRGIEQDKLNGDHILAYISHYEHLNGICVLLKPNNERLTINFRYCFKEILTHLNISAKDNLMFIFTSGRTTFFRPGSTTPLLRKLLTELNKTWNVEVPFNQDNTFIFDSEAFRFLAASKNGIRFSADEIKDYSRSWSNSIKEFSRLIGRIVKCELHAVRDSLSINAAKQLIHKLTRPIGEIARLIQENLQLAEKYKQDVLKNPSLSLPKRIPQKTGKFIPFDYPRTVCTRGLCTQIIVVDGQKAVNYRTHCHPQCYLRDVERECVGHPILQYCDAINKRTELCKICGCHWLEHMHISYEYKIYIIYVEIDDPSSRSPLASIDQHISALRKEEAYILEVCGKLSQFIKQNSIIPYDDDIIEYIRYFIREEEQKRSHTYNNDCVIQGLKNMIGEYKRVQKLFHSTLNNVTTNGASNSTDVGYSPEDIFSLTGQLYRLPINGPSIRQQIEGLKEQQLQVNDKKEHVVQISSNPNSSTILQQLKHIVEQR